MVARSSAGVHVLAGLIEAARFMTARAVCASAPPSFATATAVLIVPQVACECTVAPGVVAAAPRRRAASVARHDALDQPPAVQTALLGDGERARDDVDRRVPAA